MYLRNIIRLVSTFITVADHDFADTKYPIKIMGYVLVHIKSDLLIYQNWWVSLNTPDKNILRYNGFLFFIKM